MNRWSMICCALLAAAAGTGVAAPIPNGSFADHAVGWFDGRDATCPEICQRHGASAETEKNTAPPVSRSHVCKVRKAKDGPYWWLFGTQFGSRPACYVTDRDLKGEYVQTYYCLCVKEIEPERSRLETRDLRRSVDDG